MPFTAQRAGYFERADRVACMNCTIRALGQQIGAHDCFILKMRFGRSGAQVFRRAVQELDTRESKLIHNLSPHGKFSGR